MYTFSMRPYCPGGVPNRAINFEQEKEAWTLSNSSDASKTITNLMVAGLAFYSPLESVDISVHQLAAMVAGLDTAYETLCNALYEDAPKDLAKTQWGDLDTFMACNAGFGGDEPREGFTSAHPADALPVPFLYNESTKICIVWTGAYWGKVPAPADVASYDSAGTCFGWKVLYKEESMSTERMRDPNMLADMIAMLLEDLSCLNTPAKRYTSNIYSVR